MLDSYLVRTIVCIKQRNILSGERGLMNMGDGSIGINCEKAIMKNGLNHYHLIQSILLCLFNFGLAVLSYRFYPFGMQVI